MRTKYFAGLMGLILLMTMGIVIVKAGDSGTGPTMAITPSIAPLRSDTTLVIMGTGFTPGKKILVMFEDKLGVPTAIPFAPVVDKSGTWGVEWNLERYAGRGIITEGLHQIKASDLDYNVLATAPVGLVDNSKDSKKWPQWAAAAGIKHQKKKKKKKK